MGSQCDGSAVVLVNDEGEVLLMRRAYPPGDWILPGGNAQRGESPVETAVRETFEELRLRVTPERMTGIYYQTDHPAGEFIHFVFACSTSAGDGISADPTEVAEFAFCRPEQLPKPMSLCTRMGLWDAFDTKPLPLPLPITLPLGSEDL
jgi:8-oxo-dGTP diphosphatase